MRHMGDANIPGYNRALVAPTGFAGDPYPFFNNNWQILASTKVRYNAQVHPVLGTQIVPARGMGRLGAPRSQRPPRIYNPLRLSPRPLPRMRGLGDERRPVIVTTGQVSIPQSQLQPYGVDESNSPVYIDPQGNVYAQDGTVLTDLSKITTLEALQNAGVVPTSLSVGPPNQVYVSPGAGGINVTTPPPTPHLAQQSWFDRPSGVLGLSNGALVGAGAGAAVLLSTLGGSRRR